MNIKPFINSSNIKFGYNKNTYNHPTKNKSNRKYNMDDYMKPEPEWLIGGLPGAGMMFYGFIDALRNRSKAVKDKISEKASHLSDTVSQSKKKVSWGKFFKEAGPGDIGALVAMTGIFIAMLIIGHPDRKDPDN